MVNTSTPISILHVDDDPNFGKMAARFLKRENDRFEIDATESANAALELLSKENFDCIVSDYQMPGLNGIEFLRNVRENHPDLPFILFTGKGSEQVASEAISAGVTDYLQKETGTEQYEILANRIQNVVMNYRAQTNYREMFEKMPDGVTLHDTDSGALIDTNEEFCDMLGYTREELLALNFEELHADVEPYTIERAEEYIHKAATEGPQTFEWLDQRKDGGLLPVEVNLRLSTIDGQERILAVVRDISDRKEQEERFEALIDHSNDVITVVDDSGMITYQSPSVERILGYPPDELIGTALFEYVHPEDLGRVSGAFTEFVESREKTTKQIEFRFQHKDGTWVWLESIGSNQRADKLDGFVVNSRDISKRKRLQEKLAKIDGN